MPSSAHRGTSFEASDIRFQTRDVTPEEIAAVSAVLVSAAHEQASALRTVSESGQDAWNQSQRSLRMPIVPGPFAWRHSAL